MSSGASLDNEKLEQKSAFHRGTEVTTREIDVAAGLALPPGQKLDPTEALRIRRKIDWHILPLMCILYLVQFMDKTTLGSAAILGIREDNQLSANDNVLSTVFYISYFIFQYPQNLALQRFPVAKWMSINIFIWSVALATQAACKGFGGLFALRFILGMCEGSITAGFMLVTSMFYTRAEQSKRVGYWFLMNGAAVIISGFLSFGMLHVKKNSLHPWQWFMITTGLITFVLSVLFWLLFPDSPANAWFLTLEERKLAVERIKINQTGLENKYFKKEQFMEAIKEPRTWLFALFAAIANIPNGLTNQGSIIINSFGYTPINTTLLASVFGVIEIVAIWSAVYLAGWFTNARAYVAMSTFVPSLVGAIVMLTLDPKHKLGLLFGFWLSIVQVTGFVLSLGWVTSITAGHTKRTTVNAIFLGAYSLGNVAGPQIFQAKYAPRNRVPWIIIAVCYFVCPWILWWIRIILSKENKMRDAEAEARSTDADDYAFIGEVLDDGTKVERRVEKAFLDLTDKQNRSFRYVL